MLEDKNRLINLSFPTILCLIVFLMLALKASLVFYSCNNFNARLQSEISKGDLPIQNIEEAVTEQNNHVISTKSDEAKEPVVSVLITDASGSRTHKNIEITGTSDYMISSSAETRTCAVGESIDLSSYFSEKNIDTCSIELAAWDASASGSSNSKFNQTTVVYHTNESEEPAGVEGIQILSLRKSGASPIYPGALQIQWDSKKQEFYVVNEVNLENYLPGVVSSEMPDDFGLEALKSQAVCARSYAMSVLENEKKESTGSISWNLVDTTDDQVYMSGPVDALAVAACEQTKGEILTQDNSPIKPHYYSTSWGEQADGGVFSREDVRILEAAAAVAQTEKEILEMNEAFVHTYELLEQNVSGENISYDLESPWFRWTCSIPLSEIGEKDIEEITVTKRGTGGYASNLLISYKDGTAEQISGANSIRERLGSENNLYYLKDGSTRSGLSILPSAFFYLDSSETSEGTPIIKLHGGGFGHGYGMSQYGAAKMAETEHNYTEILSYYYNSAQICEYY